MDRLFSVSSDRQYRETVVPPTRRSTIGDRAFAFAASRVWNSLPLTVTSLVSARVQATAQDGAVCPLLRLLTMHTVCVAIPSSDLLNIVWSSSSRSTLRHINHIRLL